MGALFGDFGWSVGTDENSTYVQNSSFTPGADDSTMDKFLELFGITFINSGFGYGVGVDGSVQSIALYGSDFDNDGFYNTAWIRSDQTWSGTSSDDAAMLYKDYLIFPYPRGIALVRVRVANVPEPAPLAIFALGMIGLASRRFKKQS
ncbi:PEP-CTERM sorting domain-containing protein [Paraglaciecola sp. MB-3u-78]|uniref:PEP-CTERM sorting domain-containing protein n=1 Tax=Paraglaciecola sp. MB-3u-78 TaxID=2058332 RepID=UPI0012FE81F4|nr:PEP-CTERM sorting domain-containing protein [Paraglaciecola sp. MB-3u-78]